MDFHRSDKTVYAPMKIQHTHNIPLIKIHITKKVNTQKIQKNNFLRKIIKKIR